MSLTGLTNPSNVVAGTDEVLQILGLRQSSLGHPLPELL